MISWMPTVRKTQRSGPLDTTFLLSSIEISLSTLRVAVMVAPPSKPMESDWMNKSRFIPRLSIISLIPNPPRLSFLNKKHWNISLPQSGNISNLLGNLIIHQILFGFQAVHMCWFVCRLYDRWKTGVLGCDSNPTQLHSAFGFPSLPKQCLCQSHVQNARGYL